MHLRKGLWELKYCVTLHSRFGPGDGQRKVKMLSGGRLIAKLAFKLVELVRPSRDRERLSLTVLGRNW